MVCCKIKQWGNSMGMIIPSDIVRELHLKPDEEICVEINRKNSNVLKEMFGSIKFSKPIRQLVKDGRKDLESKYL